MQHLDKDQGFSQVLVEAVILLRCLQLLLTLPGQDLQLLPTCTGSGRGDKSHKRLWLCCGGGDGLELNVYNITVNIILKLFNYWIDR